MSEIGFAAETTEIYELPEFNQQAQRDLEAIKAELALLREELRDVIQQVQKGAYFQ